MKNEKLTKRVVKVIFAWKDEKEEKWLEQEAEQGWKLISAAPYFYTFQRSEPEKVTYRLDYKLTLDKDYQEYLSLFRDAGWELVVTFANWHYFRIARQDGATPEIYNTGKTKAQKYRRLLWGLFPLLLVFINPLLRIIDPSMTTSHSTLYTVLNIITAVCWIFMLYAVIRVWIKIKKLENQHKE